MKSHNPAGVYPPYVNYAHAVEVPAGARTLHISGINGYDAAGREMPADFGSQVANVWDHLRVILDSAGMDYGDLVALRFFLARAADDPANVEILHGRLGGHLTARTVVVQQLLDPAWLIEVDGLAAKI